MRKPIALLLAAALILSVAGTANAAIYTWTLIEGAAVSFRWPNEANSPNVFEADGGLLGRILATTDPGVANTCELAPSYPCAAGAPPVFLLAAGTAEGPPLAGGGDECNRKVIACGGSAPAAHGGHVDGIGEYSYLVIHTEAQGSVPTGKGIGFFAGSFVQEQDEYECNDCPPTGKGHDENDGNHLCVDGNEILGDGQGNDDGICDPAEPCGHANLGAGVVDRECCTGLNTGHCDFLSYTTIGAAIRTVSTSLWLTQSTPPFGHAAVRLQNPPFGNGAGSGEVSVCGNGLVYQDLATDLCVDGLSAGGNFTIPNQKTVSHVYSVDFATNGSKCNGSDCYIQHVIIPAALAQDPLAKNVQILAASSILPSNAPGTLANGSVDSLLFMYTTQLIDFDGDGVEDPLDPCPTQNPDNCTDTLGICSAAGSPPGYVVCSDSNNNLACLLPYQCNVKADVNNNCESDINDENIMKGVQDGVGGLEHWNTGYPIGPFDP